MTWKVCPTSDLTEHQLAAWRSVVDSSGLDSPYFRPEYIQCVASVMPNIEVAILEHSGAIRAIFPFERARGSRAVAPGRALADYQGIIHAGDFHVEPVAMLRECGLARWDFDHLQPSGDSLQAWSWTTWQSPRVNVSGGSDSYFVDLFARHKNLKGFKKSHNRLTREVGPVELEFASSSESCVDEVLNWKIAQYEASGRDHPFREPWIRELLLKCLHIRSSDFQGIMTVLRAGQTPVAIEYSLRSHGILHTLVSAYDIQYARYSPGMLRDLAMIEQCAQHGIHIIDMGKGLELYKQKLKNDSVDLLEGSVDSFAPRACLRSVLQRTRYTFLRSRWSEPAKKVARSAATMFPPIRRWLAMR